MDKSGPPPQYAPPSAGFIAPSTSVGPQPHIHFGPQGQRITCPCCNAQIVTRVRPEITTKTHVMAAILCLVSCCCLPYLFDSCKSQNHYCPNCNAFLGSYQS